MALDPRSEQDSATLPPFIADGLDLPGSGARVAPLRPMDRAWLLTWSAQLDPRRHAAVSDRQVVSTMVRDRSPDAARGWRYLQTASAPDDGQVAAPGLVPAPAVPSSRPVRSDPWGFDAGPPPPAPRSMGAVPASANGHVRRTAELLAVLSACLDPAERRAEAHAMRVAVLSSRLATELGMDDDARSDLLYAGLLLDAGSTGLQPADHPADEPDRRRRRLALSRQRRSAPPEAPAQVARHLSRPDRAAAMVRVLGLSQGVLETVASAEERWDGRGPRRLRRAGVPATVRVLAVAVLAAETIARPAATTAMVERVLRRERGRTLDSDLVDHALPLGRAGLWAEAATNALLDRLLELEPPDRIRLSDDAGLDAIAGAFGDLVDTRTPAMGRHGRRVADLVTRTGAALGLERRVADDLRRAALLHDIGKLLVPIAFLEKPEQLTDHERLVIGEHARAGAAVLGRSRALGPLAPLIVGHHERLDGTGLFPAIADEERARGARLIALCDRFEAMTSDRPWRPALSPARAWRELRDVATEPLAVDLLQVMERTIETE